MLGKNISYCKQMFNSCRDADNRQITLISFSDFKLILFIKNLLLFFSVFILFQNKIFTQQEVLPFEHFSVDQGMPTVTNCILQDKIGFLWFATNSGLYKYDKIWIGNGEGFYKSH